MLPCCVRKRKMRNKNLQLLRYCNDFFCFAKQLREKVNCSRQSAAAVVGRSSQQLAGSQQWKLSMAAAVLHTFLLFLQYHYYCDYNSCLAGLLKTKNKRNNSGKIGKEKIIKLARFSTEIDKKETLQFYTKADKCRTN